MSTLTGVGWTILPDGLSARALAVAVEVAERLRRTETDGPEGIEAAAGCALLHGQLDDLFPEQGAEIAAIVRRRRASVEDAVRRLEVLDTLRELGKPIAELARSFMHLHANRLLGCGHPPEQKVLGLLLRTRKACAAHP